MAALCSAERHGLHAGIVLRPDARLPVHEGKERVAVPARKRYLAVHRVTVDALAVPLRQDVEHVRRVASGATVADAIGQSTNGVVLGRVPKHAQPDVATCGSEFRCQCTRFASPDLVGDHLVQQVRGVLGVDPRIHESLLVPSLDPVVVTLPREGRHGELHGPLRAGGSREDAQALVLRDGEQHGDFVPASLGDEVTGLARHAGTVDHRVPSEQPRKLRRLLGLRKREQAKHVLEPLRGSRVPRQLLGHPVRAPELLRRQMPQAGNSVGLLVAPEPPNHELRALSVDLA
mmetsp:Transcript_17714/g.41601  ORF Transcript_17714/g.41601 Transcript_17714/m.41601 type:complete len:289 (+) Transcript_17714:254-1120(+)